MKYLNILIICLLCSTVTFYSCGNEDAARKEARENLVVPETPSLPPTSSTAANPPTPEPAQNAAGVWHYTCSNGCAGGGGSKGPCSVCGNELAHNQAYHANNNQTTPTNPGNSPIISTPSNTPTPPITPKAEPAQNAAGVWHYTCTNGCAGGGGSAGTCSSCGGSLAHNQAYHQ